LINWSGFLHAVLGNAKHRAQYATQAKKYEGYSTFYKHPERRYSPGKCCWMNTEITCGNPDPPQITTSHAERLNGVLRYINKRFTRLTCCYSKKLENLIYSVALTVGYFNFCRTHSAHGQTPAQNAGLTDHAWTVEELLSTQ